MDVIKTQVTNIKPKRCVSAPKAKTLIKRFFLTYRAPFLHLPGKYISAAVLSLLFRVSLSMYYLIIIMTMSLQADQDLVVFIYFCSFVHFMLFACVVLIFVSITSCVSQLFVSTHDFCDDYCAMNQLRVCVYIYICMYVCIKRLIGINMKTKWC